MEHEENSTCMQPAASRFLLMFGKCLMGKEKSHQFQGEITQCHWNPQEAEEKSMKKVDGKRAGYFW